jgi:shikimate dehydrogenase
MNVFLLGYPLGHSLSPAMHNAAFRALDLDWQYALLETPRENLRDAITRVRAADCAGANVTIPHKQAVIEFLDGVSDFAQRIGAVNTLVKRDGQLIGENTDVDGILQTLRDAQVDARGAHVVLLGAGGAARAVAFALADAGAAQIVIINRTEAHAEKLADAVRAQFPRVTFAVNDDSAFAHATLIVNATSVGMSPHTDASPMPTAYPRNAVAFDLVYRPARTQFLRAAETAGAQTIGGLGMLVYQGAASFKFWTGRDAPVNLMFEVTHATLADRR